MCAYTYTYSQNMNIANRLDIAMREAGFDSQSALSRASGVPQPTINRILKSVGTRGPEAATLQKLALACNVTFDWLHEGVGKKTRVHIAHISNVLFQPVVIAEPNDPNFYGIPKVKLELSAGVTGFQTVPEIYDGSMLSVSKNWVDRNGYAPGNLLALTVKGESMEPNLFHGDVVIINTADTKMVDGSVYAINYEGEAVIKRLARDRGEWWLTSDNVDQKKFRRKGCREGECIIVGKVVRRETDRI